MIALPNKIEKLILVSVDKPQPLLISGDINLNPKGLNNIQEIQLKLTVDETNLVLNALGNMPFTQVYQLVNKIQQQASEQLNGETITPKAE